MADGRKKLFDTAYALDSETPLQQNNSAVGEPKLINKHTDGASTDSDRLEELCYAERYRQRLRRGRTAGSADDTEKRVARVRALEEEAKREAMEREHSEAREHSDRISELLLRIDNINRGAKKGEPEPEEPKDEPLTERESDDVTVTPDTASEGDNPRTPECRATDAPHIITVAGGVQNEILHIGGMTVGNIAPSGKIYNFEDTDGDSSAHEAPAVSFVPLRRQAGESTEPVRAEDCPDAPRTARYSGSVAYPREVGAFIYPDPERGTYGDAEHRVYSDPERGTYGDTEHRVYSDPERGTYGDTEHRVYSDPERGTYGDAEHRVYSDPERGTYGDTEHRVYSDPERGTYGDTERHVYSDPEHAPYAEPERGVYPDPRREGAEASVTGIASVDTALPRGTDISSPYPEIHTYEGESGGDADGVSTASPYPEVGGVLIRRRPVTARELRAERSEERRLMREDVLRFERESRVGEFTDVKTPDPEHPEYRDAEGNQYPDPEVQLWAEHAEYRDSAGTPTEYADLPREPEVSPDGLNARALRKFMKRAIALDLKRIGEGHEYRLRELKLELRSAELRFAERKDKHARTEHEIRSDISELRKAVRREKRRAKAVGRLCTAVLLTNFATAKIKRRVNRAVLVQLRAELLHLLTERYHLDGRLIAIYTGADSNESTEGRHSAQMKGRRRAYKMHKRVEREIVNSKVSHAYKKKIYALMDEHMELSGELERIKYSLKRERPHGALKRELKRKRRKLKRKLARIADNIAYYKKRGIERAEDKRYVRKSVILGWLALGAVAAVCILCFVFWGDITAYFGTLAGGA